MERCCPVLQPHARHPEHKWRSHTQRQPPCSRDLGTGAETEQPGLKPGISEALGHPGTRGPYHW